MIGRSVSSNNNSFTSQLTLTINERIFNKTIECAGNTLSLSSESILCSLLYYNYYLKSLHLSYYFFSCIEPIPPQNIIRISEIHPQQLRFSWQPVSDSCPINFYIINSTSCGVCPNATNSNSVSCNTYGGREVLFSTMFAS